jgi:hypothetical protein
MGKGKSSGRGGAKYGAGGGGKYSPSKYGRPTSGGKYNPQDTVAVYLTKQVAGDLLNALIIALGVVPTPYKKGKGKKKNGGGKKYTPPKKPYAGKPYGGKPTGGKTYRVKPTGTKAGGKPKPYGRGK